MRVCLSLSRFNNINIHSPAPPRCQKAAKPHGQHSDSMHSQRRRASPLRKLLLLLDSQQQGGAPRAPSSSPLGAGCYASCVSFAEKRVCVRGTTRRSTYSHSLTLSLRQCSDRTRTSHARPALSLVGRGCQSLAWPHSLNVHQVQQPAHNLQTESNCC
jgi:hypothetical protein